MKSDKEFLKAVYQKAEHRKERDRTEEKQNVSSPLRRWVPGILAALLCLVLAATSALLPQKTSVPSPAEFRMASQDTIMVEADIISLEETNGGYQIQMEVLSETWEGEREIMAFSLFSPKLQPGDRVSLTLLFHDGQYFLNEE